MIVSRITGGLGNQLFQYGFGLFLSKKNNCDYYVYVDDRYEKTSSTKREFILADFKFQIALAPEWELKKLIPYISHLNLYRLIRSSKLKWSYLPINRNHLVERNFYFDENYFNIKSKDLFLDGYWQSYKYVDEVRDILIKQFILLDKYKIELNDFYNAIIKSPNSVSIHVRRGDFISNSSYLNYYGVCDIEYYKNAIKYIENIYGKNLIYFIFSDDIDWVKMNFSDLKNVTFISHQNPSIDLKLMSLCNHNIIANSTFSWWGAYLNQNINKIVIRPEKWLKDKDNMKTKLLFPLDWIAL